MRASIKIIIALVLTLLSIETAIAQAHLSEGEMELLRIILSNMKDNVEKVKVLDNIARKHSKLDSIAWYSLQEYQLAEKLGDTAHISASLDRIGWCYALLGDHEQSLQYYTKAYLLNSQWGDSVEIGRSLSGIGDVLLGLGDFDKGVTMKTRSLSIAKKYNNRKEMAIIYRSIGKACADYQLYKMANDQFHKAFAIDKELVSETSLGRDLHFIARTYYDEDASPTIQKCLSVKDTLIQALMYHIKTEDYIYAVHTCMNLSLVLTDLTVLSHNWSWADSSMMYYNKGRKYAEMASYKRYHENYDIVEARHHTLAGNNAAALEILNRYKNDQSLSNDIKTNLYRTFDFFYHFNKDYKGLYENKYKSELNRKESYISELYTKVSNLNTISEYEQILSRLDDTMMERERNIEQKKKLHKGIKTWGTTIIILILVTVLVLTGLYIHDKRENRILANQRRSIARANDEISLLILETTSQSYEISQQTREMKRQRNKLASFNLRIVLNLEIGRRIQRSVIQSQEQLEKIFGKMTILWRPLEEVSGDFYWGAELHGLKILAVADCTGHGIPGAFLSMLGVAMLNSIVPRLGPNLTAARIITKLKERVEESFSRGDIGANIHDGMDIAITVYNPKTGELSYSGAYRPLWVVSNGKLTEYKGDNIPVGVDPDRQGQYTNHTIRIHDGDRIYMFSDGITDQYGLREDGRHSKYKAKRLRTLIERIHKYSPDRQLVEMENEIDQWRGPEEQTDDILVIGLTEQAQWA